MNIPTHDSDRQESVFDGTSYPDVECSRTSSTIFTVDLIVGSAVMILAIVMLTAMFTNLYQNWSTDQRNQSQIQLNAG